MPTDREQQEVERLRWVFWECDCGALNREARPGFQHPCPACGHPATIDPVEVMPVSDHAAALQAEREKTEAAKLEASDLRVELQLAEWDRQCLRQKLSEQPDMADISGRSEAKDKPPITTHSAQPDTEGGDAHATRRNESGIPVAEGAAVDDGRALSEHWREQAREAAMHSPEYGEQAAWEAARLAEALRAYAAQEDTYADQAGNAVEFGHRAACHRECAADLRRAAELLSAPTQPDLLEQAAREFERRAICAAEDAAFGNAELDGDPSTRAATYREVAQYLRRMRGESE